MANSTSSFLNVITFVLTTIAYYVALKPSLTLDMMQDSGKYQAYLQKHYMYLGVYIALVLLVQFVVNVSIITNMCGGSIRENIGYAGLYTFLPWSLLFGAMILVLSVYPGFKSAFSDVVGYFWVSKSANDCLTELLFNQQIETNIQGDPTAAPQDKETMEKAADLILKLAGNASILINQMVPGNFMNYWNVLKPLMKPQYKTDDTNAAAMKEKLFEIVVARDNVGEVMWYVYTGLFVCFLVQLKITSRGCVNSPETMEKNYQQFLADEAAAQQQKSLATSTTYTITG
jgi:hypothetical protein